MVNVINTYTLAFVILSVFVTAAYLLFLIRKKELLNIIPLIASLVTVFLLYRIIASPASANYYDMMSLDMCIALISTILAIFYISRPYVFITLVIILLIGVLVSITSYGANTAFAGMFAIGTIYGLLFREFVLSPKKEKKEQRQKSKEINRDIIQIILGAILVAVVYYFSYLNAVSVIFALIILAYAANNILANLRLSPVYKKAMDLERKNVTYGLGATYLAASTAMMLGFTHTSGLLLFGITALFFGDSVATIVGLSMRRPASLPYNRFKTIVGSLAFLVVTAVVGYFFIGIWALPLAIVLAFVESLNISIDDNVRTGIIVVVLGALLGL